MTNRNDYLYELSAQLYDRLTQQTTGALLDDELETPLVGGVYNELAKDAFASTLPFVVFSLQDGRGVDGFPRAIREVTFVVNVYVPGGQTFAPMTRGSVINERITGNWQTANGGIPTYGLDRWKPQLGPNDDWQWSAVVYRNTITSHDAPDWYHWALQFSVFLTSKPA